MGFWLDGLVDRVLVWLHMDMVWWTMGKLDLAQGGLSLGGFLVG